MKSTPIPVIGSIILSDNPGPERQVALPVIGLRVHLLQKVPFQTF